jgi:hypothetical protein
MIEAATICSGRTSLVKEEPLAAVGKTVKPERVIETGRSVRHKGLTVPAQGVEQQRAVGQKRERTLLQPRRV